MRDYLDWRSKISLNEIFADSSAYSYPTLVGGWLFYLTSLAEEKGRTVLMRHSSAQSECVTPSGFSMRTKINEYGGKPFWVFGDDVIFVNQSDQCLYKQRVRDGVESEPVRMSCLPSAKATYMYSDVQHLSGDKYLCVVELFDPSQGGANNQCFIGLVDGAVPDETPTVIQSGADFYCNLVFHTLTGKIAWVEWDHPNMPWDRNTLMLGTVNDVGEVASASTVICDPAMDRPSHCQLAFAHDGSLYFSVDFANESGAADYWSVYVKRDSATPKRLTHENVEFGYPHWQYGDQRIVRYGEDAMLFIGSCVMGDAIYIADQNDRLNKAYKSEGSIQSLHADASGNVVFVESGLVSSPEIIELEKGSGSGLFEAHSRTGSAPYAHPVGKAEAVSFPSRDGQAVHGFYYAPVDHSNSSVATCGLPPLLVMVHGGPTARAYAHFDLQKQFWLSNGFAIFDVNPRGSTGFGRRYRDALYDKWGNLDIDDVVDGVEYLIESKRADPQRICIRGKSSGGYAVLRALTEYPDIFQVGVSYYGIGNLATLAEVTHKFEKHYTDRLIGETYEPETAKLDDSEYVKRSPIYKIDQIQSAMLVFQGAEDLIVPPQVAHEIVEQLSLNQVTHEYHEYAEEGHGFRQSESNIDAWQRELNFYRTVLKK